MANPAPGFRTHPEHRILLDTGPDAVTVTWHGTLVAATTTAIIVREDGYPARAYVPRRDVVAALTPARRRTRCPFKGEAVYFNVVAGGDSAAEAAWSYEAPYDEMAALAGHVAFDDRFEVAVG